MLHINKIAANQQQMVMKTDFVTLVCQSIHQCGRRRSDQSLGQVQRNYRFISCHEIEEEQIFMRLFPYSDRKTKGWYIDQLVATMTNWNTLEDKFLTKLFPHSKITEAKTTFFVFSQGVSETLCKAWERYKSMLRNYGFDDFIQIQIFRNVLHQQYKLLLYAKVGRALMSKSFIDAIKSMFGLGGYFY